MNKAKIAIVGAGAAGLMAAEVLSEYDAHIYVYDQKPTAARKILMAGKTGLNISHAEPMSLFVDRYTPSDWLAPFVQEFGSDDIRAWMAGLGVDSYVGSSGRIFPVEMKASKLVRSWLHRLMDNEVKFYYRHRVTLMDDRTLSIEKLDNKDAIIERQKEQFDAVILACGGGSYAALGSDGAWQAWFRTSELTPLKPSNVGVLYAWSDFMNEQFGKPLKRVCAWVNPDQKAQGDIIITHYGLESGLIYKLNRAMQDAKTSLGFTLYLDLLPNKSEDDILKVFHKNKKQSLNTTLKRLGMDATKIAILRECTQKTDWSDAFKMTSHIKSLAVLCTGFRPIDEAISTSGGVKRAAMDAHLQLRHHAGVFCCGEMMDWDAPTGGYLLTACLATGRAAAKGAVAFLNLHSKPKTGLND